MAFMPLPSIILTKTWSVQEAFSVNVHITRNDTYINKIKLSNLMSAHFFLKYVDMDMIQKCSYNPVNNVSDISASVLGYRLIWINIVVAIDNELFTTPNISLYLSALTSHLLLFIFYPS